MIEPMKRYPRGFKLYRFLILTAIMLCVGVVQAALFHKALASSLLLPVLGALIGTLCYEFFRRHPHRYLMPDSDESRNGQVR